jgi:hypothetical protein
VTVHALQATGVNAEGYREIRPVPWDFSVAAASTFLHGRLADIAAFYADATARRRAVPDGTT